MPDVRHADKRLNAVTPISIRLEHPEGFVDSLMTKFGVLHDRFTTSTPTGCWAFSSADKTGGAYWTKFERSSLKILSHSRGQRLRGDGDSNFRFLCSL
jgi:hypothetical protein